MPTINPFDNDRLKTSKVRQALDEAGVLPTNRRDRPTFLRSRLANEALINRALERGGAQPIHLADRPRLDAMTLNSALTSLASGSFLGEGDSYFAQGRYTLGGEVVEIGAIIDLSFPDEFDPAIDIDEQGVKPRNGSGRLMRLVDPLLAETMANGYTIVLDMTYQTGGEGQFSTGTWNAAEGDEAVQISSEAHDNNPQTNKTMITARRDGEGNVETATATDQFPIGNQVNRLAGTIIEGHMAVSVNGAEPITMDGLTFNEDTHDIWFQVSGTESARMPRFTIYPPADDSELAGLSAL